MNELGHDRQDGGGGRDANRTVSGVFAGMYGSGFEGMSFLTFRSVEVLRLVMLKGWI